MISVKTLWQFSRPHTIIGSICSITTLYILANRGHGFIENYSNLLLTLVAGIACNIFIVGLNQLIDIEVDKINKPYLPLASGAMTISVAKRILIFCLLLSLLIAFLTSYILGWLIVIILLLGIAYSVPPIQLKKHHLPAAIAITLVRGVLVNLGMFVHFRYCIWGANWSAALPAFLLPLTLFIIAFSVAIAWFKDLPDTEGDAKFNFKTLSLLYNRKTALVAGSSIVLAAYLYCIGWAYLQKEDLLLYAHIVLALLFVGNIFTVQLSNLQSIKPFYMRFWVLFFAEYILFAVWGLFFQFS